MSFLKNIDWNKVAEKGNEFAQNATEQMEKKKKELIRKFKSELRRMDDQKIRNGLRNINCDDWRYEYIVEEATKRGM